MVASRCMGVARKLVLAICSTAALAFGITFCGSWAREPLRTQTLRTPTLRAQMRGSRARQSVPLERENMLGALQVAAPLLVLLAVLLPRGALANSSLETEIRHVYSVGDLHGDYKSTEKILTSLGLMGSAGEWTGGQAILVQTGDITDRGDESGEIFRALFRLQDEAPQQGGRVILLLGNHELMNLQDDFRYSTQKDTLSLLANATSRSEAFSRNGWLGQAIRQRMQAVALLGPEDGLSKPVLFVHAGLLPNFVEARNAEELNGVVRQLIDNKAASDLRDDPSPLLGDEGPFWTRQLALGPEAKVCQDVQKTLQATGATRMIVGHTAQADGRIHDRCEGRFVLGDSLISQYYTGTAHPSALELFSDGTAEAIYPNSGRRLSLRAP